MEYNSNKLIIYIPAISLIHKSLCSYVSSRLILIIYCALVLLFYSSSISFKYD